MFLEVQGRKLEMGRGSKDRNGSGRPESGWEYAERNRAGGGRGKALGPSARCGGGGRGSGEKTVAWWAGVQEKMGGTRAGEQVPTSESGGQRASP